MNKALVRQAWNGLAVLSVCNLVGLAGLTAVLAAKGALSRERLHQMVAALRGEYDGKAPGASGEKMEAPQEKPAVEGGASAKVSEPLMQVTSGSPVDESRKALAAQEMALREKNRFDAEIQQRLALANSALLDITQKREALNAEREAFEKQQQRQAGVRDEEGFKKELEVFNTLKPTQAFEYLARKDAAQAARILMEMDSRTAAKILEAARSPDQKQKADDILVRMREVAPAKADAVNPGETKSGETTAGESKP